MISNKVLTARDHKWRSLDSRAMYAWGVSASELRQAVLADHLTRALGVDWEPRSRGRDRNPDWAIASVPQSLARLFSQRSADIDEAALSRGTRASLVAAVGCTLGIVPHMVAAITGLAAVLHTSAFAFQTLKYVGVAYLLYLAWQTWRDTTPQTVEGQASPQASWQVIRAAVLINVLNPKLTIFFFAFLPQFVQPGSTDAMTRMLGLSVVFMAATLVVFTIYGVFAAGMRRHVISRPEVVRWMRRVFGGTYVVMAGRLAVTGR